MEQLTGRGTEKCVSDSIKKPKKGSPVIIFLIHSPISFAMLLSMPSS